MIPRPVANAIIVVITVIWAANFTLQFFVADYQPDSYINTIFLGIVGGALALSRRGDPPPSPPPPPPPPPPTAPGGVP